MLDETLTKSSLAETWLMDTSGYLGIQLRTLVSRSGTSLGFVGALVCLCNIIVFGGTVRAEGRTVDRPRAL
jgi:hypothetical protein